MQSSARMASRGIVAYAVRGKTHLWPRSAASPPPRFDARAHGEVGRLAHLVVAAIVHDELVLVPRLLAATTPTWGGRRVGARRSTAATRSIWTDGIHCLQTWGHPCNEPAKKVQRTCKE